MNKKEEGRQKVGKMIEKKERRAENGNRAGREKEEK
jgi:hypothetical protein